MAYYRTCLALFLLFSYHLVGAFSIRSPHAILMTEQGRVLFEKAADESAYPASTTKLATALFLCERYPHLLNQMIIAQQEAIGSIGPDAKKRANYSKPPYWIETGSNHIGIKRDELLQGIDLLKAMLITSANDASNVLAERAEGSISRFMEKCNAYLKEIGCQHTHFNNPHGLYHPKHYTCARDMACIAKRAMQQSLIMQIVKQKVFQRPKTNKQEPARFAGTNPIIRGPYTYSKAIGMKSGHTKDAGWALIGAAEENGCRLITVILDAPTRQVLCEDTVALFEMGFALTRKSEHLQEKEPVKKQTIEQRQNKTEPAVLKTYPTTIHAEPAPLLPANTADAVAVGIRSEPHPPFWKPLYSLLAIGLSTILGAIITLQIRAKKA